MSEIKTQDDIKNLLRFLSSSMSLSARIQGQCREAYNLMRPSESVAVTKPVGQTYFTTRVKTREMVRDILSKIERTNEIGILLIQRIQTYGYDVMGETLASPSSNPWKYEMQNFSDFRSGCEALRSAYGSVQILYYVNSGAMLYRCR
jgi:hypothetical protein